MDEDIAVIKNEEDYIAYGKLRPVNKYKLKKVQFICSICNKESIKTFERLKIPFVCKHCTNRIAQLKPETREKIHKTFIDRYGSAEILSVKFIREKGNETIKAKYNVDNISQVEEIKEKKKKTTYEHYGVEHPLQSDIIKQKLIQTNINNYGVENVFQSNEVKEKIFDSNIKNFGVKFVGQVPEYREKTKLTNKLNHIKRLNETLLPYNIEYISNSKDSYYLKCNNCNETFSFSYSYFYELIHKEKTCFCPHCSRIKHNGYSFLEKELFDYISSNYSNIIIENDRTVLEGKELDIYLPELKLAFEFDGTYWHADPRFFSENDMIKHKTVKEIWERDTNKNLLCEQHGITLIRIKEYDWNNDKENIKNMILNQINNKN